MAYPCTSSADCVDVTDGCCLAGIFESIADDSDFGQFLYMWNEDRSMPVVGQQINQCSSATWQELVESTVMPVDGISIFQDYFDIATDEEFAAFGIAPGTDVNTWIEDMGSNVYTWENLTYTQACVEDLSAMSLITTSAMIVIAGVLI